MKIFLSQFIVQSLIVFSLNLIISLETGIILYLVYTLLKCGFTTFMYKQPYNNSFILYLF